ncbi:MAG: peptidoglycan-associated lipoprotein Pal [Acidobacteriota bacterium]|nr:peptidoglycan-associated lipoprotein Pal [Acidobacteriota bacterium]MDH3522824.1 peptidoglycan-associated lipoprotein Pal [Acidobacteriota bacterium]
MSSKWIPAAGAALIAVVLVSGCAKKPPVIPEPAPPPPPAPTMPTVVEPAPAPPTVMDDTPNWETGELGALNEYARANGLLGDVYFDFDKSDLRSDATDRLAANAAFMREHPNLVFTVEGHCDERGTNAYNLALGDRRANAASGYLGSLGIAGGRLTSVSYGEERPQCTESYESCWAKNRRAHFVITGN